MTLYKVTVFRSVSVFESYVETEEYFQFLNNAKDRIVELRNSTYPDHELHSITVGVVYTMD